ncbi:MAG: endonuclease III [Clostridia bacterium]|nr:endonuclease III [Clostridia bacterium]
MNMNERVMNIIDALERLYPDAKCSLEYKSALELLVATQLAAQCTDARVNIVTQSLYKKYKTAEDFANADSKELEEDIKPTGFYHNKAKNIKNCCKMIIDEFNGQIPNSLEDLLKLPGVGRKTANLVLGDIFGVPGVVVDTHAKRLANRIGLSSSTDPAKIELDLMKLIPKEKWSSFCHRLVYHGRAVCKARKPECHKCEIRKWCERRNLEINVE